MSNVIRFLETMGASDSFGATADYVAAVNALEIAPAQRKALLDRDVASLNNLLDGRQAMFCMIIAPDDAEEKELPDQADEQTDGDKGPPENE